MSYSLKYLLLSAFCYISCMAEAQTNRFFYQLTRQTGDTPQTDLMVLDVNPEEVKFYDEPYLKNDSLSKKNPGHVYRYISSSRQVLKRKRGQF